MGPFSETLVTNYLYSLSQDLPPHLDCIVDHSLAADENSQTHSARLVNTITHLDHASRKDGALLLETRVCARDPIIRRG